METSGRKFVQDIENLYVSGGGHCPELTFTGILEAMKAEPEPGSPMYVFTDATAKDATEDNITEATVYAKFERIPINFFTTGLCGRSTYKPFEDLARETCGYMFKLPSSSDLSKLSAITSVTLQGATCQAKGGNGNAIGKKKRSTPRYTYRIPVDDSTDEIFITVKRQGRSQGVTLKDPRDTTVTSGVTEFDTDVIYKISKPQPGTWKLTVSGNGKHSYQVKGVSNSNLDFEYFFVIIPAQRSNMPIPITIHYWVRVICPVHRANQPVSLFLFISPPVPCPSVLYCYIIQRTLLNAPSLTVNKVKYVKMLTF